MTRAEFYDSSFKSNLTLILVKDVKVWQSKEWVEIEDFSSFEKHFDE
jgi:hypothetical protein